MSEQYVLSLSYGKDSLACLGAIKQLGLPLDRIVHAEIWATDTISADLPPMVEFKKKADEIIKERYGIEVEHICALKTQVWAEANLHTNGCFMKSSEAESLKVRSKDSPLESVHGVKNSNMRMERLTNDCEYGCDNPCQKAKDFYKQVGNKLDELLDKCRQLLRKEDEGK